MFATFEKPWNVFGAKRLGSVTELADATVGMARKATAAGTSVVDWSQPIETYLMKSASDVQMMPGA